MNQFKVSIGHSKSKPIIIVYYNHKRHRYWNGKVINVNVKSIENSTLLKAAFELKLREGWRPQQKKKIVEEVPLCVIKALKQGVRTITFKNKIYFNENQSFTKCSLNNCG